MIISTLWTWGSIYCTKINTTIAYSLYPVDQCGPPRVLELSTLRLVPLLALAPSKRAAVVSWSQDCFLSVCSSEEEDKIIFSFLQWLLFPWWPWQGNHARGEGLGFKEMTSAVVWPVCGGLLSAVIRVCAVRPPLCCEERAYGEQGCCFDASFYRLWSNVCPNTNVQNYNRDLLSSNIFRAM